MASLPQNPSESFKRRNAHLYHSYRAPTRPPRAFDDSNHTHTPPDSPKGLKRHGAKARQKLPHEDHTRIELPDTQPTEQAGALAGDHAREAPGARCPHVCFTLVRVKLLDVDAKYGSIKDLLDGLQYAGLVHSDKEGEITLEVKQQKVRHYSEEKTIIEVTSPGD